MGSAERTDGQNLVQSSSSVSRSSFDLQQGNTNGSWQFWRLITVAPWFSMLNSDQQDHESETSLLASGQYSVSSTRPHQCSHRDLNPWCQHKVSPCSFQEVPLDCMLLRTLQIPHLVGPCKTLTGCQSHGHQNSVYDLSSWAKQKHQELLSGSSGWEERPPIGDCGDKHRWWKKLQSC